MSEVFIRNFNVPANCMECEWRDAEACGECELMISNPFLSLEEQFAHCPFRVIAKSHPLVPVPPHGRLIDADKIGLTNFEIILCQKGNPFKNALEMLLEKIENAPTIIEAEEGE